MPDGASWASVPLEALLVEPLRNGVYKPKEFHGRGTKIVNMGELFANDVLSSQEMKRLQLTDGEKPKVLLRDGDLLFARRSVVLEGSGRCVLVVAPDEETTFESSIIRARPNPALASSRFLFYQFRGPTLRAAIAAISSQTAVSGIRGSDLAHVHVTLPSLGEQERIAGILSAYDDLIENCERRIRVLDEMARALYREWFVNFRYPGHEKVPLVDSTLGRIPKGWPVTSASQALVTNPKIVLPRDGERPFVPMTSLSNETLVISDVETRSVTSGSKFQNDDTLFARITPCLENGKTGFVQFLSDDTSAACGSTEFIVLRGLTVPAEFVYCLARSPEFRGHAIKSMSGATGRQRVQEACFDRYFLAQPPTEILNQFAPATRAMFRFTQSLHQRAGNLRKTRDLLLPRLLSGQLSVADAAA